MHLKTSDFTLLDKVFGMENGWVLNFSNSTFSQFFADEIAIDINDPRYATERTSKAKRLRTFLRQSDAKAVVKTLKAL